MTLSKTWNHKRLRAISPDLALPNSPRFKEELLIEGNCRMALIALKVND
jgi:hypothetical protein